MSHTHGVAHRRDVAADVTAKILSALGTGTMPWRKPWDGARTGPVLPRRANGELYRGVNTIMLWYASAARGFASPYWLTFNQAVKLGAQVRKGERGEVVVYYGSGVRPTRTADGAESESAFRFLKSYTAFNADQIEGLPEAFHPKPTEAQPALPAHERWFGRLGIERMLTRDLACYIPSRDVIGMPPLAAFDNAESYAATLNHESVHATAAPHRVGRDLSKRFREAIAAEELVALS